MRALPFATLSAAAGCQQTFVETFECRRVVNHTLSVCHVRLDPVWQAAWVKRKHGICMSDGAAHRRSISAIGDVQLGGDELIGQDQTGIRFGSGANGASGLYKEDPGERRFLLSGVFGLCPNDVRIWARAVAVVGAHPVIIEPIRSQPGNVLTGDVADIPILVPRHVTGKVISRGDVQPVTGRTAYAAPVRNEAARSLMGVL